MESIISSRRLPYWHNGFSVRSLAKIARKKPAMKLNEKNSTAVKAAMVNSDAICVSFAFCSLET